MMNHREHRGSQELIGVVQPWEGMPFRRAVHLIWRTYGTAEQAAEKRACATNRCHSGFKASLIRNGFRGSEGRSSTVLHACASFSAAYEALTHLRALIAALNATQKPAFSRNLLEISTGWHLREISSRTVQIPPEGAQRIWARFRG